MKIYDHLENKKRKLASWLTSSSERYSRATKKRLLIITGLACSILCLSLILNPLLQTSAGVKKTTHPKDAINSLTEEPVLSKDDQQALEGFIYTLDSIQKVDSATYEQAMKGREGLLDSIRFLLQYAGKSLTN